MRPDGAADCLHAHPRSFLEPGPSSALERRASSHVTLTKWEREQIRAIGGPRTTHAPREIVSSGGDALGPSDSDGLGPFVVEAGALVERAVDAEGRVQVYHLLVPGDVIGLRHLPLTRRFSEIQATTPTVLSPLSREGLRSLRDTRLGRLLDGLAAAEHAADLERLRIVGRARAQERIIHLFLELNGRQRRVLGGLGNWFWCPFPQNDIGDAVGLTNVYVSKMLSRLRERGVLRDRHGMTELHDIDWLAEQVDYKDPFATLDLAWVEEGRTASLDLCAPATDRAEASR